MPVGCANRDRKPSANSRSLPGGSSRPASRARKPRCRGAAIRSSTWVTTCSAVACPKRASSAAGPVHAQITMRSISSTVTVSAVRS